MHIWRNNFIFTISNFFSIFVVRFDCPGEGFYTMKPWILLGASGRNSLPGERIK